MRILIYGLNYRPEPTGVGRYTADTAEWFAERGHRVRVVTGMPYYPDWKIFDGYPRFGYRRSERNGVEIVRCPLWVPRSPTGFTRMLHLASFALSSGPALLYESFSFRPDVVLGVVPTFFTAPSTLAAAALSGAQSWMHVQDLEIDAAIQLGIIPSRFGRGLVRRLERWIMNRFDGISTISGAMQRKIEQKTGSEPPCLRVPNWVDTERIHPRTSPSPLRSEWGYDSNDVVVLYSGNIGAKQGLEAVVDAARRLQNHSRIQFLICGEGPVREALVDRASDLSNVRFVPLQPEDRFNDLLNLADIHLVPQCLGADGLVMPSKMTGILACGGRVLATCEADSELAVVSRSAGGRISPPDAPDELARVLEEMTEEVVRGRKNGKRDVDYSEEARAYAMKHFERTSILSRMEDRLIRLTGGREEREGATGAQTSGSEPFGRSGVREMEGT